MIKDIFIWSLFFLFLIFLQFFIGEYYLVKKKGFEKTGYGVVIIFEILTIIVSCYLMVFSGYLEFLGLSFLLITFYLSNKFINRGVKRHKEKAAHIFK